MKKAVIYVRVSSDEQIRGSSLDNQEELCRRYCAENQLEIAKVYREEGESAKSADRPLFKEMVAFCIGKKTGIGHVVVYKLDRFARNSTDYHIHIAALARAGVTVRSATEPIDDNPVGKLLETVLAGIAQFDNDIRGERSRMGMESIAKRGGWCFQAPLGYKLARLPDKTPILEADPEKGPLVRKLFEALAAGRYTATGLAVYARQIGLVGRDNKPLQVQSIHALLRTNIYAGRIVGRLTEDRIIRAAFEPLVSEDLFDRVQLVLSGQGHVPSPHIRNHPDFPLRRFICCGKCAKPLTASFATGRNGTRYPQYRCVNEGCRAVNVRAENLHLAFMRLLQGIQIVTSPLLQRFRANVLDLWQLRQAEAIAAQGRLKAQAEELARKKAQLLDKMLDGTVDKDAYRVKNAELTEQLALARVRFQEAAGDEFSIEVAIDLACMMVQNAGRLWAGMESLNHRQRLQAVLFPHGLGFSPPEGGFGTAANTHPATMFREFGGGDSGMAPPTGFEPVLPG